MGRRSTIRLDDPDTQKAVEMYRNGASLAEAAQAVYISTDGLRHRFKVLGIPLCVTPAKKSLAPEIVEKIRQERQAGKSYRLISRECNVSYDAVRKYTGDIKLEPTNKAAKKTISLDDPKIKKIVELYQGGATFEKTAEAVGLSSFTVKRYFKILGIPARKPGRRRITSEQIERIHREYKSGKSCYRIAKEMRITPPTVCKYAK